MQDLERVLLSQEGWQGCAFPRGVRDGVASTMTYFTGSGSSWRFLTGISDQNKDGSIEYSRMRSAVNFRPSAYTDGAHQYILACSRNALTQQVSCHTQFVRQLHPFCKQQPSSVRRGRFWVAGFQFLFFLSFAIADTKFKATSQDKRDRETTRRSRWPGTLCDGKGSMPERSTSSADRTQGLWVTSTPQKRNCI